MVYYIIKTIKVPYFTELNTLKKKKKYNSTTVIGMLFGFISTKNVKYVYMF